MRLASSARAASSGVSRTCRSFARACRGTATCGCGWRRRDRHRLAAERDGGTAGTVEAVAVGMEAVGLPGAHADRGQAVGRDDRLDLVEVVAEVADGAPDVAPLLLLGEVAAHHEIGEGAEGDHVLGEDRAGAPRSRRRDSAWTACRTMFARRPGRRDARG